MEPWQSLPLCVEIRAEQGPQIQNEGNIFPFLAGLNKADSTIVGRVMVMVMDKEKNQWSFLFKLLNFPFYFIFNLDPLLRP